MRVRRRAKFLNTRDALVTALQILAQACDSRGTHRTSPIERTLINLAIESDTARQ